MAIRFELKPNNRNAPDEAYLDDLRLVAARLEKQTLTMAEYRNIGRFYPSSVARRFGSWTAALAKAGLAVQHFNGGVPQDDALKELRDIAERLGQRTVTREEYRAHSRWGTKPLERHYGSWLKALAAAGLEPSRSLGIADEDLFQNLETMWRTLGRQPNYSEVTKPFSLYSAGTYAQRFGSWRKALEAFVATANSGEPDTTGPPAVTPSTVVSAPTRRQTARSINWRLRFLVLQRDGFRCCMCGASPATQAGVILHVDHVLPWSRGGETVIENLRAACEKCNIGKSDLSP